MDILVRSLREQVQLRPVRTHHGQLCRLAGPAQQARDLAVDLGPRERHEERVERGVGARLEHLFASRNQQPHQAAELFRRLDARHPLR